MKNAKLFIGIIIGIMISASVAVYALSYYASDITYKNKTVEQALNDLYKNYGDVYGIVRNMSVSSSSWLRIDASEGLVANANVGTTAVKNDFDNIYPWSDIVTVAMDNDGNITDTYDGEHEFAFDGSKGEVMTYIPEFYYKRKQTNGYEYIYITKSAKPGFTKSEEFYIGRYAISSGIHSISGTKPQQLTIANHRTQATSLGAGWQLMDYHYFIIQLLYLVEYADYNSQAKLGQGNTNNSATITSGGCNELGMKSGMMAANGTSSVIYRGIEDVFGNVWQLVDGINSNGNYAYISYDASKYKENEFSDGYSIVNYNIAASKSYISKLGYDENHPLISLPTQASGSATTYITDLYRINSGNRIAVIGGRWDDKTEAGLWDWAFYFDSSTVCGARLIKI